MAFFRNDAVNRVNLHSGVVGLAQGAGTLFFFVFLLKAGVSVPMALLSQAAIVSGRFLVRPLLLPLARRWGVKRLLIFGTLLMAAQYPLVAEVRGLGPVLVAVIVVSGLGEVFYWMNYNAYYSAIGDAEHRGHQLGAREALMAVVGIVAPLAGAWMLVTAGPRVAFAAVALVQVASAIPLLGAPDVAVKAKAPGGFRAARPALALMIVDGWFDVCYLFVWQIALFVTLRESFSAYGGAMALAGLLGAVGAVLLGRHVDAGHGRRAALIAYSLMGGAVVLRAASLGVPALAVVANAAGALLMPMLIPPLAATISNRSQASPCPLRFAMVTEAGWDIGCCAACLTAAGLYAAGAALSGLILLALPAIGAGAVLLWRLYPPGPARAQTVARPTLV